VIFAGAPFAAWSENPAGVATDVEDALPGRERGKESTVVPLVEEEARLVAPQGRLLVADVVFVHDLDEP
jgi:hypothetical protein